MIHATLTNETLRYITEIEKNRFQVSAVHLPVPVVNRLRKLSRKKSSYASNRIEGNPLTEKQVDELAAIADMMEINVICYGLRTDFRTKLFPGSKRLFEIADSIEEIKSSCSCNSKTIFNARIDSEGKVVTDGEQIEVGGNDKYIALCRKCYFTKTNNPYYRDEFKAIEDDEVEEAE